MDIGRLQEYFPKMVFAWVILILPHTSQTNATWLQYIPGEIDGLTEEPISAVINKSVHPEWMFGIPFTSCGHTGRYGPTQHQCDIAYANKSKVKVFDEGPLQGVQVWVVPATDKYGVTALGADGGSGAQNTKESKGGYAHAKFNFTAGEHIYMLVGQQGGKACSIVSLAKSQTKRQCQHGSTSEQPNQGGGGGGGGGTFVFKRDPETGQYIALVVAGGGGGKSYLAGNDAIKAEGGYSEVGPGTTPETLANSPGAGGGWDGNVVFNHTGLPLLQGAVGGQPCPKAQEYGWEHWGGFGGGGGGCTAGGGGGGYTGGNVSLSDNPEYNGQGGASYINPEGEGIRYEPGTGSQNGHGEVEIALALDCECQFMCIYQNYERRIFECYCPPNTILTEDKLRCVRPELKDGLPRGILIAAILGCVGVVILSVIIATCVVHVRRKRRPQGMQHLADPDYQLGRLRTVMSAQHANMAVLQYNPNYDFGGAKCSVQDLPEIPREMLTLIKALGQGAFGEVYQGELRSGPAAVSSVRVAIKTLTALCTNQAEMDFLMEALIMSKFNHPNIVQFIGVCFEKHPRFIILELLEAGDLKTFLREARPKPESPINLTMRELLKLAGDVANGCHYLEDNHFIHRADYYRKGGKAMLPVKWMPPEAFLDGIFTSKTDVWSFGILLWEVFSLGFMPYPGRGNQEVMELVTAGGRLEPPQNCPSAISHIMSLCWHGIPERRPTFSAIIQKLDLAYESREVRDAVVPVFNPTNRVDQPAAVMRPPENASVVLSVEPRPKCLEPDSPLSTDQLLAPLVTDHDSCGTLQKTANLSPSAESLDKLLKEELSSSLTRLNKSPQPVFRFDGNPVRIEACDQNKQLAGRDEYPGAVVHHQSDHAKVPHLVKECTNPFFRSVSAAPPLCASGNTHNFTSDNISLLSSKPERNCELRASLNTNKVLYENTRLSSSPSAGPIPSCDKEIDKDSGVEVDLARKKASVTNNSENNS